MRPLSELHVLSRTIYVINTDMAVSLADFTAFFQEERKSIKSGENYYKSGHVESCSYSKGEFVSSVSQRRENVMTSVTWLVLSSLSLHILTSSYLNCLTTNIDFLRVKNDHLNWRTSYVWFRAQVKPDQKIIFLSALTTIHIFSVLRFHGIHLKGHDLGIPYIKH